MPGLKTEYASMEAAARGMHTAIAHLPGAIAEFQRAMSKVDAFGHLPEAGKAKHTVSEAMKQLGTFSEDLHTEWEGESKALVTVADVLRKVDALLAREARGQG